MQISQDLPASWDLWLFDKNHISETNEDNFFEKIKNIQTIQSKLEFANFYVQFNKPKNLRAGCEVFFFKKGIKPLWEDPKNQNGGSFFLHIKKTFSNKIWENLLFSIVSQQDKELECVNGIIMRVLKLEIVFFVWTRELSKEEETFMIRWMKDTTGLSSKIKLEFKPHPKKETFRKKMKELEEEKLQKQIKNQELPIITQNKKQNLFSQFNNNQESSEEEQEVHEQKQIEDDNEEIQEINVVKKKNKRRRKKKKTKPVETIEDQEEENNDVIEEEIEEIKKEEKNLLSVSKKMFNYNKELNSLFQMDKLGATIDYHGMNKKQQRIYKHQLKINKPKKRYYLVHNEDVLQKITFKLDMKLLNTENKYKTFGFSIPQNLEKLEPTFQSVVNTHDPNLLNEFLHKNPYHPKALYHFGEYYRLQGNYKEANMVMEQLLFVFEESLSYDFKIFEEEEKGSEQFCILQSKGDYELLFFKAILKFILILLKKSCFKTSFSFTKLLLKLNPIEDPMGALVMIDHVALLSSQYEWLINFTKTFCNDYIVKGASIFLYPNILYSLSLAKFELHFQGKKIEEISQEIGKIDLKIFDDLFTWNWTQWEDNYVFNMALAIILYPQVLRELLFKTEQNRQNYSSSSFIDSQKKSWEDILKNPVFIKEKSLLKYPFLNATENEDIEGLEKIFEIYSERNCQIWKKKKYHYLMRAVAGALVDYLADKGDLLNEFNEQLVNPSEETQKILKQYVIHFSPRKHKQLMSKDFSDEDQQLDINNIPDNLPQENYNPIDMNQNWFGLLINSLLPWNHLPNQDENNQLYLCQQNEKINFCFGEQNYEQIKQLKNLQTSQEFIYSLSQ